MEDCLSAALKDDDSQRNFMWSCVMLQNAEFTQFCRVFVDCVRESEATN